MLNVFKVSDDQLSINGSQVHVTAFRGKAYFVDGDTGVDTRSGRSWHKAFKTIQAMVTAMSAGDTGFINVRAVAAGGTDPVNYAETIIIPAGKSGLRLIGVSDGPAQGHQPQIKVGAGSTAMVTARSPGVLLQGITINGGGSTGGGILLDDNGSTKTAFGVVVQDCMLKNCVGSAATDAKTGGAIMWSSDGGPWQCLVRRNRFYNNIGGIVLLGTGNARPKDIVVAYNDFGADAAASVDCYIYGAGGSGFNDVVIAHNTFSTVLPNAGTVNRYMDLTGVASGLVANNYFAGIYTTTGFGAAKAAAKIPTALGMPHNYSDSGLIVREA